MTYLTCLETSTGGRVSAATPRSSAAGETLQARYDFERVKREVSRDDIAGGPASLWRYAPLLPVENPGRAVSLNEGYTPLLQAPRLARTLGLETLRVKDEGRNPSGTFKD